MTHWKTARDTLLKPLTDYARFGIITDFDGTLSPIVDDPAAATIHPASHAVLTALVADLPLVALVSGRGAADVQRLAQIEGAVVVGNHGMERWENGTVAVPPHVAAYRPNLEAVLAALKPHLVEGMQVEDKGATASVHYRRTAHPLETQAKLRPILGDLVAAHGMALHAGKMVFELRPPLDLDKGTTFAALIAEFGLDAAIYVGDDVTDADALRKAGDLRAAGACYALGIGVQHPDDTPSAVLESADLLTDGVADTAAFFGWLHDVRREKR